MPLPAPCLPPHCDCPSTPCADACPHILAPLAVPVPSQLYLPLLLLACLSPSPPPYLFRSSVPLQQQGAWARAWPSLSPAEGTRAGAEGKGGVAGEEEGCIVSPGLPPGCTHGSLPPCAPPPPPKFPWLQAPPSTNEPSQPMAGAQI